MIYGALYDIEEQLKEMGFTLANNPEKKRLIDKLHFGLNINHIHGILTDSQYNRCLDKLNKMVWKYAERVTKTDGER